MDWTRGYTIRQQRNELGEPETVSIEQDGKRVVDVAPQQERPSSPRPVTMADTGQDHRLGGAPPAPDDLPLDPGATRVQATKERLR